MAEASARLGDLVRAVRDRLAEAGVADASLDARVLVTRLAGVAPADLIARPERPVPSAAMAEIDAAVARRAAGEPTHRVLGFRDFYGLELALSPATLEPRPDTEALVDLALPHIRRAAARWPCRVLDLGTGSGAIALAILANVPDAMAVASDISEEALQTARSNAEALGLAARFAAVQSDWFSEIDGRFDAILSNPPYIPSAEIATLEIGVRGFDPRAALDGGPDGLEAYRRIAADAPDHLREEGCLAVEVGRDQAEAVGAFFQAAGFRLIEIRTDLGGVQRALLFCR